MMSPGPSESRPGTSSLPVKPVTPRTWSQLEAAASAAAPVALIDNQLFGQAALLEAEKGNPNPQYQPLSARGTPSASPQSSPALQQAQQQPGARPPSRLGVERAGKPPRPVVVPPLRLSALQLQPGASPQAAPSPAVAPSAPGVPAGMPIRQPTPRAGTSGGLAQPTGALPPVASSYRPITAPGPQPGVPRPPLHRSTAFRLDAATTAAAAAAVAAVPATCYPGGVRFELPPRPSTSSLFGEARTPQPASLASLQAARLPSRHLSTPAADATAGGLDVGTRMARPPTTSALGRTSWRASSAALSSTDPERGADFTIRAGGAPAGVEAAASVAVKPAQARPSVEAMAAFVSAARCFVVSPEQGTLGRQLSFSAAALAQLSKEGRPGCGLDLGTERFLTSPGPVKGAVLCRVVRTKAGLLGSGLQYTMVLEEGRVVLLTAQRWRRANGATAFNIMVSSPTGSGAQTCVARLASNFLGTEYVLQSAGGEGGEGRCELGAMLYTPNVLGAKGPRKETVVLPKLAPSGQAAWELQPACTVGPLVPRYRQGDVDSCIVLRNRPPRWNDALGAYCLNFGGRVTQASVKNLQLVSMEDVDRVILQFGRVGPQEFTLDYAFPATPLQAFAIALASLDPKLGCE